MKVETTPEFAADLSRLEPDHAAWEIEHRNSRRVDRAEVEFEDRDREAEADRRYAFLADHGATLLARAKFCRSMGVGNGPDWDRLRSTEWEQVDPEDFEQKDLLDDLLQHAGAATEVHLLIVHSYWTDRQTPGGRVPSTRWVIHQKGTRFWLGVDLMEALQTWAAWSCREARSALEEFLRAQTELATARTLAGFVLATIVERLAALCDRVADLAAVAGDAAVRLRRVLAPGGATSRYIPLT